MDDKTSFLRTTKYHNSCALLLQQSLCISAMHTPLKMAVAEYLNEAKRTAL